MKKILLLGALLGAFATAQAAGPATAADKKKTADDAEPRKAHSDPRFKGKVMVIGTSSESFGQAPPADDLKTRRLETLEPESEAPRPLPLAPPAKK